MGTFDWIYDDLGRLIEETYGHDTDSSNDYSAEYFFDLASNRVRKDVDTTGDSVPDERTTYTYDDNDRLLTEVFDLGLDGADKTTTYEYGAANDRTEQTNKSVFDHVLGQVVEEIDYAYNLQGRLSQVVADSDGNGTPDTTSTYEYNDQGIRVSQTVDDGTTVETTDYVIDSNNHTGYAQVLEERNALTGIVAKTFTIGHDVIAQQAPADANADALTLVSDGHGSTRMLVDPTGQPLTTEIYRYDAYGNPIGFDPGTALTSLLYSGEQTDITGLQYLRARYYDLATGRFNRLDPFAGNIQDPLSLHKYLYTHGNPVMGIDPSGLLSLGGLSISISVGGALRGISQGAIVGAATGGVFGGIDGYLANGNVGEGLQGAFYGAVFGGALGALTGGLGTLFGPIVRGLSPAAKTLLLRGLVTVNLLGTGYSVATAESLSQGAFRGATGLLGGLSALAAIRQIRIAKLAAPPVGRNLIGLDDAAFEAALRDGPDLIEGFQVFGNKGRVGNTFNRSVFLLESDRQQSIPKLVRALEAEAREAGAQRISIIGVSVINTKLFNSAIARRFGFAFRQINDSTIHLTKAVQ